ncbi:hypothetical protein O6H91_03G044500 [Diphasiastrum complanatum]|uniref:Uncharacterized protein n=2 Tax=Diphasiastrum complanatum TaxID=34168 RepID=A0ACC2E625_DIPCM|nr:hypothetical protein O6H91_03G044500 [Diphasiastrum complanatum]KAJ7561863.1 hypothetical protein O6H91_03G044500 [Diphasiastrum complanatum]
MTDYPDAAWEAAMRATWSGSTKQRIAALRGSIASLLDTPGISISEHVPDLVNRFLGTLSRYDDRASQAAVEHIIIKALREPSFVKTFTGAIVQTAEKELKVGTCPVRHKLLRWSCLIIQYNPDILTVKTAFSRLAAIQASLLSILLHSSFQTQRVSRRVVVHLLSHVTDLFERYVKELRDSSIPIENSSGLINVLLGFCSTDSALYERNKDFFLDIYIKEVLTSKEKPSKASSEAFEPLFKQFTHEDFAKAVVPAAIRMLKRNPELSLETLSILLKHTNLDLSKYVGDFQPLALLQARHSDESRRNEALAVVSHLASHSSDVDALAGMFQSIKSILQGSEGKLTFPYQRVGMVNAVIALCEAPRGKASSSVASSISNFLLGFYREDGNEEVRGAVLIALSAWLARAGSALPTDLASFFVNGLKEKESLRRAHLRCLRVAFQNTDLKIQMYNLVEHLVPFVKSGVSKPALRLDGIYSLLLLAWIAAMDVRADERLNKEKIWTLVLQKDSTLLSPSMVGKLQPDDCEAVVELVEVLHVQHSSRIPELFSSGTHLLQLLVNLLWHPVWNVRKSASLAVAHLQLASLSMSESLLDSFLSSINNQMLMSSCGTAEAGGDVVVPTGEVLSNALFRLADPILATRPNISALLLLYSHHPFIARGRNRNMVWRVLVRALRKKGLDVTGVLGSSPSLVCKILMGSNGLMSHQPSNTEAAISALASLVHSLKRDFFPHFIAVLKDFGDPSDHDALTQKDIKIFNTPEGILSTEQGIYVAEVVSDRNIKQAKGRFRMYEDTSDQEAPPAKEALKASVRQATMKKDLVGKNTTMKGLKKPSDNDKSKSAKEEARDLLLKEESIVRIKVKAIKERLSLALSALSAVVEENPDLAHERLSFLVELVRPLLSSLIVGHDAFEAMVKLARCVSPPLRHVGSDLAAGLKLAATSVGQIVLELGDSEELDKGHKRKPGSIDRCIAGLVSACKSRPLPAPTFTFIFPIVEQVLLATKKTRVHDDLLKVLALHCSSSSPIPRLRMISVLYHVLGCVPTSQSIVHTMLAELCRGLESNGLAEALVGLYSEHAHVRVACLNAVVNIPILAKRAVPRNGAVAALLWIALYDSDERVAEAADIAWDLYGHELGMDYAAGLVEALSHSNYNVREAAAAGLAAAMDEYPNTVHETLSTLFALYTRELPNESELDSSWQGRQGVALTLLAAADLLSSKDLPVVSTFLISRALADENIDVRVRMVDAGIAIIDKQGKQNIGMLLPIFENYLNKKAVNEERYDLVREGVVIYMGALAKHLDLDDSRITVILERLMEVLNTPSESVQRAVSNCLSPLMQSRQVNIEVLTKRLLDCLLRSDKYGERRGAAFGLAGVVKGLGISSLKQYGIMNALKAGVEDRNVAKTREGALLGFECLSEKLGRLFEPYVIHILPVLLVCFSDPVVAVRDATDAAARTIMSQLSGQGVKLVLPALLKGLEDKAWRTKQGSVQLLGTMAFCAPRQLSQCLPTIVPKLSEVLTDTHPKVQAAAQTALQQVGSVIRNPEIAALVPTLLIGIADPNEHTKSSLDILLQTTFVNTVDAPSLALLVPIVHRGLRERSAETKKKAAQIVGNMSSLVTDHKDMLPYLGLLLPEVKKVLVDPIPEVRTVAARALGSLIKGMGEENFKDLVPLLLDTLKSENSSVERSGAAQGLSEVLAALGTTYFESLLPEIIQNCSHQRAAVRDGYLTLFKYLPGALGPTFQIYLQRVLPAILDGLADENESVRDAALSAGHILVEHYATTSLPLLLPAVEEGIFHDNWRIRQSSVELLGDLLFKVAGTSGKVVLDGGSDDEGASTEAHGRAIVDVLGKEKRNEVLAAVYMVRSDVSLTVRQAALHVWKTVVANTPKTLKEIMPVLMSTLIASLASSSSERRQVAGRSLGELVRKLGDRVLPSIIPILAQGLEDQNGSTRQGVCIGLSEVMASAGKHQLVTYMGELIPTIRTALCDSVAEVREAAGLAFSTLFKSAGMQAIDEIVPALLAALEDSHTSDTALDGLKQILSVRTAAVLPHILPKLVSPPFTAFNAHALGTLAAVAGPGVNGHLGTILPPLMISMSAEDEEVSALTRKAAETVVTAVDGEGLLLLISELVRGLGDTQASIRRGSAYLTGYLFKTTKMDLEEEVPNILTTLIVMLTDLDNGTVQASWEALASVVGTITKENLPSFVKVARDAISTTRDRERRKRKGGAILIPGFCLPKGLQPVLPIYLQGLMSGSPELREQAAEGLGELINVTSEIALKPFVVPITGPLIRIIGDRFPWQVKSAILGTLGIVINKGGIALKPFLPQLQTTFIKCLQDNTRAVRSKSAWALGKLTGLSTRVDPLVGDLLSGMQTLDGGIKEAMLVALKGVVKHAGKSVSTPVVQRMISALQDLLPSEDEEVRGLAGRTLGILSQYIGDPDFTTLLDHLSIYNPTQKWTLRHGTTLALASVLRHSSAQICITTSPLSTTVITLKNRAKDDKVPVRESTAKALGRILVHQLKEESFSSSSYSESLLALAALLTDDSSDVRRRALSSLKIISKVNVDAIGSYSAIFGRAVGDCLKDSNTPVRLAAERCALHLFQLNKGAENVQAAQKFITGLDARRIAKQSELSDPSEDSEGDAPG